MNNENPFAVPYITEASLTADELVNRYSFLPFQFLHEELTRPSNVLVSGRKGIGKTMLLKLFDPEILCPVLQRGNTDVRDKVPRATVGVYFTLDAPFARLAQFRGQGRDGDWWVASYSDFLNCLLLRLSLSSLQKMCEIEEWRTRAGLANADLLNSPQLAAMLLSGLREESWGFRNSCG